MERLAILLVDLGIFGGVILLGFLLIMIIQISSCLIFNINLLQTFWNNLFLEKGGVAKWQN